MNQIIFPTAEECARINQRRVIINGKIEALANATYGAIGSAGNRVGRALAAKAEPIVNAVKDTPVGRKAFEVGQDAKNKALHIAKEVTDLGDRVAKHPLTCKLGSEVADINAWMNQHAHDPAGAVLDLASKLFAKDTTGSAS